MKVVAVRTYLLLATAIFLFLAFAPSPPSPKPATHHKLQRRLGNRHAPFDPMATKIIDGKTPTSNVKKLIQDSPVVDLNFNNPFSGVFEDPEEYFREDGDFNIEARLKILFPLLDRSPEDGFVSLNELEAWNLKQAMCLLVDRTERELEVKDRDDDGLISFAECLPEISYDEIDRNDMTHGQGGWWEHRFVCADVDGDGYLNFTEYMEFLYPEDSQNEKIQLWYLREKLRGMDHDKDSKLNFIEFADEAYENYRSNFEFQSGGEDAPSPEEIFRELDLNNDSVLTEEELRPIIHYTHPGELAYAKHYTGYLIHEVDDNKDAVLTLKEMLDHHPIFYSTVIMESDYESDDDNDEDDDYLHYEL